MPIQGRITRPYRISSSITGRTSLTGIAKPMPMLPPVLEVDTMAVLMPISSPLELTSAPPEFPWLMAASVWMTSPRVFPSHRDRPVSLRADHAHGDRALEAQRVADGDHPLARAQARRIPHGRRRKFPPIDFHDRQIVLRIGAQNMAIEAALIRQRHDDPLGILDYVVVRDHAPIRAHDHARGDAVHGALLRARRRPSEPAAQPELFPRLARRGAPDRIDIDDRRLNPRHRVRHRVAHRPR